SARPRRARVPPRRQFSKPSVRIVAEPDSIRPPVPVAPLTLFHLVSFLPSVIPPIRALPDTPLRQKIFQPEMQQCSLPDLLQLQLAHLIPSVLPPAQMSPAHNPQEESS